MVVLVTGANGQLGQSLRFIAGNYPEIEFHFLASADLDIVDPASVEKAFQSIHPDYCVNAAAYTAVDKAENEEKKARAINVSGAWNLAEACKRFDTILIHISTDFVFDGNKQTPYSETDATNPQGIYAQTKLDGEKAIQEIYNKHFIVRTSWVYSQFGNNFMKTMLRLAQERDSLHVVDDQIGTPTHAVDLAEALLTIVKSGSTNFGIYNFSNEGITSWYGFARKIFEIHNVSIAVQPIPTSDFPTPAKRPKYSVLDKSKFKLEFKTGINSWERALTLHQ